MYVFKKKKKSLFQEHHAVLVPGPGILDIPGQSNDGEVDHIASEGNDIECANPLYNVLFFPQIV